MPGAQVTLSRSAGESFTRCVSTTSGFIGLLAPLQAGEELRVRQALACGLSSDESEPYVRRCARVSQLSPNAFVHYAPPVALFVATPDQGPIPLAVQFKNHSTGEIDGYEWQFEWDGMDGRAEEQGQEPHAHLRGAG